MDYLHIDQLHTINTDTAEQDDSGLVDKHKLILAIYGAPSWTSGEGIQQSKELLDHLVDEATREHVYAITRPVSRLCQFDQDDKDQQFYDFIASELDSSCGP